MKFSTFVFASLASLACTVGAVVIPGASTPLFYLVSTSASTSPNLKPFHINDGNVGLPARLTGNGAIGQLYFYQGNLVASDPSGSTTFYRPYISATLTSTGCSSNGPVVFVQGSTSNKCGNFQGFQIQSNTENSQLGAKLVFNYVGGFYACGDSQEIWYKTAPEQGPSGCNPVDLYTVPVVV